MTRGLEVLEEIVSSMKYEYNLFPHQFPMGHDTSHLVLYISKNRSDQ